jgi:DNA polymerase III epsilon subunit-like protein
MRYSTDIVVIDLEATCPAEDEGDNAVERSNIIEIGAVRLDRRSLEVTDRFSELVRPRDYPVAPFIARMTGITPEMVADRDDFGVVGRRFMAWYGPRNRSVIAAFGAYYDIPLLRRECAAFGLDYGLHIAGGALDVRAVATIWLAERDERTSGLTLEAILDKMGVSRAAPLHRAVDDAQAAAAVLQVFHLGRALA